MIIVSNKPGQLANLLFVYAHLLAHGTEFEKRLLNPSFHQYRSYFQKTSGFSLTGNKTFYQFCHTIASILAKFKIHNRLINSVALDWSQTADLNKNETLTGLLCFIQGWLFRSDHLLTKHKISVKEFFLPESSYQRQINHFFDTNFTAANETIIGIHLRQGDYKTFEGGKYFYPPQVYFDIMQQLCVLFKHEKLRFLLCSNENIMLDNYETKGLNITKAPNHELLDLYCLARCNYIAGPPSTYNMWASYYGNAPLYHIYDPTIKIKKTDFKVYLSTEIQL